MLPLIANKIYYEPWCITRDAHLSIQRAFESYMAGGQALDVQKDETEKVSIVSNIAIVNAFGLIGKHLSAIEMECGGLSIDALLNDLRALVENDDIDAIILNFNSRGGTSTGVFEAGREIKDLSYEKPIYAFCDSICASAGYWLASQCTAFFATPSSSVGSVGVYMALMDDSAKREKDGYKLELFVAGKYKALGLRDLNDDDRAMLQASVEKLHKQFIDEVTSVRNINLDDLEGQCFDGDDAGKKGLIDYLVMNINETIQIIQTGDY